MNLQLHYYLLRLYQALQCKRKEKRDILGFVSRNMKEYQETHPHGSFYELVGYFGEPEKVALDYLPEGAKPKKKFLGSRPILRILVLTLCWLTCFVGIFLLALFLMQHFAPPVPIQETEAMLHSK